MSNHRESSTFFQFAKHSAKLKPLSVELFIKPGAIEFQCSSAMIGENFAEQLTFIIETKHFQRQWSPLGQYSQSRHKEQKRAGININTLSTDSQKA